MVISWKDGPKYQSWERTRIDDDEWLWRTVTHSDKILVKRSSTDAFIKGSVVYVKNRDTAARLDRGLIIR